MRETRHGERLALETGQSPLVSDELWVEHLDRHVPIQGGLEGPIDRRKSAFAELVDQVVLA
jgi:hypothetical protein